ncbi:MFS transporter [Streptomyces sparsogenes]|uniref:MFS transporter n=1 Tax=Streptomyces sparsogenes TaxID=67365 RepID=UPI0033DD921A
MNPEPYPPAKPDPFAKPDPLAKPDPAAMPDPPLMSDPPAMSEGQIQLFSLGALLTMLLSLLDENIVASAAWPIARDLDPGGGVGAIPWLVTAYALAATASQPLYGKLSDTLGPRRVYLCSVLLFLLGSALCGTASDMGELIAFRALQGLGGGGLMSLTLIILATVYPPRQGSGGGGMGMGGGLVALGILAGPLLGGFLTQHLSWRWIFYVNLPLGAVSVAITLATLRLPRGATGHRVDVTGAALVTAGATGALLLAEWGGSRYAWSSAPVLALGVASAALLALFCWWETRVAEPILPMALFRDPVFRIAAPLQFLGGFAVLAAPLFIVAYLQIARGVPADEAGLRLAPVAAGVMVVMGVSGLVITRLGRYKPVLVVNTGVAALALALFSTVDTRTPDLALGLLLVLLGVGLGGVVQVVLQTAQAAAPPGSLGVVTTGTRFFLMLGKACGAAVLGAVLDHRSGEDPGTAHGVHAYVLATDTVFRCAAGVMLAGLVLALLIPDVRLTAAGPRTATPRTSPADAPQPST